MKSKHYKKGFTLIELLVVIAIIGLLSAIVLSNLTVARAKGETAKELSTVKQVQSALELYKSDNGKYPNYANKTMSFLCGSAGLCPGYITDLQDIPGGVYYNSAFGTAANISCGSSAALSNESYIIFWTPPTSVNLPLKYVSGVAVSGSYCVTVK